MREPILATFKMGVKVQTMSVCVGMVREPPVLPPGRMKSEIRSTKQYLMTEIQMAERISFGNLSIRILNLFRISKFDTPQRTPLAYSDLIIVSFMPQSYDGVYFGGVHGGI